MGKEYEAKFLDIDVEKMRTKLLSLGATKIHDRIMLRRSVYKLCNTTIKSYARVRDDGDGVSMTIKIYNDPKFPEEHEIHIQEDYDTGVKFLTSLGLEKKQHKNHIVKNGLMNLRMN
jgi:adenylate cyclase class IV